MNRDTHLPAVLRPALACPEYLWPVLPAWAFATEGHRRARAQAEACEGPYDGERMAVAKRGDGRPALTQLLLADGGVRYTLDGRESTSTLLVFRYSPADSPLHPQLMRAVEQAYAEAGPGYTRDAREQAPQHHGVKET